MIGENTHKRGLKQSIDWKLIGVYILLVLIGWVNIYASVQSANPSSIFDWSVRSGKQFVWMLTAFGLAGMILFLIVDVLILRALIRNGNPLGRLYGIILVLLCVAAVWALYLAAYCARFDGSVKDVLRYSFYLMMSHPLRSLGVMAAILVSGAMILVVPGLAALLPAVCFWISSYLIEEVFLLHMKPEDAEKTREDEKQS